MIISTKVRYALRVMIELANHDLNEYLPLKEIAINQGISEKYLEAIIKLLVKGGLVSGLRGKGGGYKLSKRPSEYTVGNILELTEGSLAPVACLEAASAPCPRANQCVTLPMWKELDSLIHNYLDHITLDQLANDRCPSIDADYCI